MLCPAVTFAWLWIQWFEHFTERISWVFTTMKLHVDTKCKDQNEAKPRQNIFHYWELIWFNIFFPAFRTKLSSLFPAVIGFLFPTVLPIAHIVVLWYFWQAYARFVDKRFCSCSCWDTVFKATYESGIASYKNFYFNATTNTLKIWLLIVIGIISLYECIKYLTKLIISKQLRSSMAFLFFLSLFSHYYAWWAYLNYLNDDFYSQWNHQTFFTVRNFEVFFSRLIFSFFSSTVDRNVFNSIHSPFSRQGELRDFKKSALHCWHSAATYHCWECRSIHTKRLPRGRLSASNR